jgi:hypothetical protein
MRAMYNALFGQFKKQLGQLTLWLDAAGEYAKARPFDVDVLVHSRLAPDQFPLLRQIQSATDAAKLGAARLTGKQAPSHADTEQTIAELRARVLDVIAYLDTFSEQDFAETATRSISQPRWEGKSISAADYFLEHVVPNFYFHLTHTYAILRHNGVPLGKRDYLGPLSLR